jgi:hypothetical protein
MRKIKEQDIQKVIFDYLRLKKIICFKHRNVGIYVQKTSKYIPLSAGEKGISDIIGCDKSGKFIAIEVKRKGNKPTDEQLDFLRRIKESGGIAILAYSLDDVMAEI